MTGFGSKVLTMEFKAIDFFGTGKTILTGKAKDSVYLEIRSAARCLEKDPQHLVDWLSRNEFGITKCHNGKESLRCVTIETFVQFVSEEAKLDNPYADQVLGRSALWGVSTLAKQAAAEGKDSIEIDGKSVRFRLQDGVPYLYMDDVANMLDISPEQMAQDIQSEEFRSYVQSLQDWT